MAGRTLTHRSNPARHPAQINEIGKRSPFPCRSQDEKRDEDRDTDPDGPPARAFVIRVFAFGHLFGRATAMRGPSSSETESHGCGLRIRRAIRSRQPAV